MSQRKFALVYTGAGLGNVVMSTPAIQILSDLGFTIDVFAEKKDLRYFGIIAGLPIIRHAYSGPAPRQQYDMILTCATKWRARGFDAYLRKGGVCLAAGNPLARKGWHEVELNCEVLQKLGAHTPYPMPQVSPVTPEKGKHVVLLPDCKPGEEWDVKRWTREGWVAVSRYCREIGFVPVAMADNTKATEWAREGQALDLGGKTRVSEVSSIIAGAIAAVSIDNGLAHIAAAHSTPLLVLWGATSFAKNRPLGNGIVHVLPATSTCAPCQHTDRWQKCPTLGACMDHKSEDVFRALDMVLLGADIPRLNTRLHLGCGKPDALGTDLLGIFGGGAWINLGEKDDGETFRKWFYRSGDKLPFADQRFGFIFSEHFFEHLFLDEAIALMQECARVLRPGGIVRVAVPDAELRPEPEELSYPASVPWGSPLKHKTRWSYRSLVAVMRGAGLDTHPLNYYDDAGKMHSELSRLDEFYQGFDLADSRIVRQHTCLARKDSLVVDGVKP